MEVTFWTMLETTRYPLQASRRKPTSLALIRHGDKGTLSDQKKLYS